MSRKIDFSRCTLDLLWQIKIKKLESDHNFLRHMVYLDYTLPGNLEKKTIPRKEKISYLLKFGIIDCKALEKEKVINDLKHQFQLMW